MYRKVALIVDDSSTARTVLKHQLSQFDLVVELAPDGNQALEMLLDHTPDMIFLDHVMPGLNGFQVLQRLKSNRTTKRIPVVMYTSQAAPEYAREAKFLGAIAVIPKNVTDEQLVEALNRVELYQLNAANEGFRNTEPENTAASEPHNGIEADENARFRQSPLAAEGGSKERVATTLKQATELPNSNIPPDGEEIRRISEAGVLQQPSAPRQSRLLHLMGAVFFFIQFYTLWQFQEQEHITSGLNRLVLQQERQLQAIQAQLISQEAQLSEITSRQIEFVMNLLVDSAGSRGIPPDPDELHELLE